MGGEGTLYVMIGFGTSAVNFSISGTFFVATSFILSASGSQKKDRSEMGFGRRGTSDVENFIGGTIRRDLTC